MSYRIAQLDRYGDPAYREKMYRCPRVSVLFRRGWKGRPNVLRMNISRGKCSWSPADAAWGLDNNFVAMNMTLTGFVTPFTARLRDVVDAL